MSKYGDLACNAVALCEKGAEPLDAWVQSAQDAFPGKLASQNKACPKGTFLGLAEEGMLRGVKPGKYTNSKKNKKYAIQAYEILCQDGEFTNSPTEFWKQVMEGKQKTPNQQMEVVTELWKRGLLVKPV